MKVYYDGRYWDDKISEKEHAYLLANAPNLYYRIFERPKPKVSICGSKIQIYQTFFDELSKSKLDGGFIPLQTKFNHNYENDLILDIWKSREWINAKYIGLLSWRFYEKTGLLSTDLKLTKDVHCYFPKGYAKYDHPFSRKGFGSVDKLVQLADSYNLFPFKLKEYKVKQNVWCNYWIAKPHIFDDYCTRYLSKTIEFFKNRPEYNLTEQHRGKQVPAMTFFLEGLFSIYLQHENINYENT
jgi:hypothetical protein